MRDSFLYFAYGSNLHPQRLARRTPSAEVVAPGRLRRHALAFHKRSNVDASGKCSIRFTGRPADVVHGVVYRIAVADLPRLDRAEGRGAGYERIRCRVELPAGQSSAWSYIAQSRWVDEALAPFDWYLALVREGAARQGLPAGWRRRLAGVAAVRDPDEARRRSYLALARGRGVMLTRGRRGRGTPGR